MIPLKWPGGHKKSIRERISAIGTIYHRMIYSLMVFVIIKIEYHLRQNWSKTFKIHLKASKTMENHGKTWETTMNSPFLARIAFFIIPVFRHFYLKSALPIKRRSIIVSHISRKRLEIDDTRRTFSDFIWNSATFDIIFTRIRQKLAKL